jgi:hypothetical protein
MFSGKRNFALVSMSLRLIGQDMATVMRLKLRCGSSISL